MRHSVSASLICLLAAATAIAANATTIHVYPPTTANPNPIQTALNSAVSGDKVKVEEGTYSEYVTVTTDGIELVGDDCTVLDGAPLGAGSQPGSNGIWVTAPNVTVRGFTVRNFGTGIAIFGPGDRVQANTVTNCLTGIFAGVGGNGDVPARSTIDHNSASANFDGIVLGQSINTTVSHNTADENLDDGIVLQDSTMGCTVIHNEADDNGNVGIFVDFSTSYNVFSHNSGCGNTVLDAEDQTGELFTLSNSWDHNKFGTKSGF